MSAAAPGVALAVIRHGRTAWNEDGRIQGRTDTPLCDAGRAELRGLRLPPALADHVLTSSPMARAIETARLLSGAEPQIEPRLAEMSWGTWEGRRLAELRQDLGAEMTQMEARGLDFRPPGGESPRDVQARLMPWLRAVADAGRPRVAVTHKGVIRALYALASGWDMTGKAPARLDWTCAHVFALAADGIPAVVRLNVSLRESGEREEK
ncbi:MAG: histidine phosphatase family protein [Alphaproteobacteria bacterium]